MEHRCSIGRLANEAAVPTSTLGSALQIPFVEARFMRKIEILYFQGCPNHPPAVELARATVAELGLETEVEITEVEIDDIEEAQSARFLGSPSIRVDGRDVEPGAEARAEAAGEFALSCRTYNGKGLPEKTWLAAALLGGATKAEGKKNDDHN